MCPRGPKNTASRTDNSRKDGHCGPHLKTIHQAQLWILPSHPSFGTIVYTQHCQALVHKLKAGNALSKLQYQMVDCLVNPVADLMKGTECKSLVSIFSWVASPGRSVHTLHIRTSFRCHTLTNTEWLPSFGEQPCVCWCSVPFFMASRQLNTYTMYRCREAFLKSRCA